MMLDDQNNQLIDNKHKIADVEKDYQRKYSKIEKNLKNNERNTENIHREKRDLEEVIESLKQQINDREENIISYRLDIEKIIKENDELQGRLKENEDIFQLVQGEINEIKTINDNLSNEIKNKEIEKLKLVDFIQELKESLIDQRKDNQNIILSYEEFKGEKQKEMDEMNGKINELNHDMLLILMELEKKNKILENFHNVTSQMRYN